MMLLNKMIMNNKKKVILFLILICLIFSGSIIVLGMGHNGKPGSGSSAGDCGGTNCIYNTSTGIRYSLVDENGNQVSGTNHVDIWWYDQIGSLAIFKNRYSFKDYTIGKNEAYYGTDIKQHVMAAGTSCTTSGISRGDYFARSDVKDVNDVFSNFSTYSNGYDRDEGNWGYYVARWIKSVSSKEDPTEVNNLLAALGYQSPDKDLDAATSAAIANYYIQYEPIIMIGRHGSAVKNTAVVMIATITELAKYDCSSGITNTNNGYLNVKATTGVHIDANAEAPSNFVSGSDYIKNAIAYDSNGKIIGEGVAHLWMRDIIDLDTAPCEEAIAHINKNSKTYPIGSDAYHNAVAKVRNGTFKYTDDNGVLREVREPQTHDFLKKNIYTKYNDGVAACTNVVNQINDCSKMLDYIHAHTDLYPLGTPAYHNAVSQVRNGTFSYETQDADGELTIAKMDHSYTDSVKYAMLIKENYEKRGGKATCGPITCNENREAEITVDPCETGINFFGDINDPEAWLVCETAYTKNGTVYSSDNTGHDAYETTNGGIVGNAEYCEVFCYENFETDFPTNVYNVKAGQTFQWGSSLGNFGQVKVTKKCSNQSYIYGQQGYRFEEWEDDYKDNEKAMIGFYMKKASYEKQIPKIKTSSSGKYTACPVCDEDGNNCHDTCDYRYSGTAEVTEQSKKYSHGYVGTINREANSKSYSTGYTYESAADAEAAAKSTLESQLKSLASAEEAKYTGKKSEESKLLEKIRQCTNNLEYLYKTTVQFIFYEPVNSVYGANTRSFSFNDYLNVAGDYNTKNVDTSKCKTVTAYSYTCTGTGSSASCTPKKEKVLDCELVTWNLTGEYTYSYPVAEFQWYSLKTDSTLVNEKLKGTEDSSFFYHIGFGLPTALSLTNGTYDLKVIVSNIGDNATTEGAQDYNIPNGHFAPVANAVNTKVGTGYGFEYACIYEVENEIFGYDCTYDDNGKLIYESPEYCDEDEDGNSEGSLVGIDVVYRLITLLSQDDIMIKAFPGIAGDGREPGSNWNVYAEESELSNTEIREILSANIYEEDQAMYEIMLDVNAINLIREDNGRYFDNGADPYTTYYDENNVQKVYCAVDETGNEKYCASDFISELFNGNGLNYRLLGTCLPMSNTLDRAEYILANGCDTTYQYPEINWMR